MERPIDRLARVILRLMGAAGVLAVCWIFRSVLVYIIMAAVLSLVGRPLYVRLRKLSIKGLRVPEWLAAALAILLIMCVLGCLVTMVIPVVSSVVRDISKANIENMAQAMYVPLSNLNWNLIHTFPSLGSDFKIESVLYGKMMEMLGNTSVTSMVGSVASFIASLGIAVFAMVFISFFFIRNPYIFGSIVTAFVPDDLERKVKESLGEIGSLISRYFIGLITEVLGVSLLNFLGLFFIARMGFRYSVGIAFMTGLFNILPYVGPLIGGALGLLLTLTIKYVCATSFGIAAGFPVFVAVVVGVFVFTQVVDNYVYQPLIYSNSIKAHPLEIFIVLLVAGTVGGMLGMLVAIPTYTVARVIAMKFFGDVKAIRMLTGSYGEKKNN